ncbi:MAG TPA: hypothetical protein VIK73_01580 [Limnochordales bacterium]
MSAGHALRRFLTVGLGTAIISALLALSSTSSAASLGLAASVAGLSLVIALGVLFDILGVAATAADEEPFHAMAADRVFGARHAIWIVRHADRVANFANDMVGDAAGILSGALGAAVVGQIVSRLPAVSDVWATTGMVAVVSGLVVGGKAAFKGFAIDRSQAIVFAMGRFLARLERLVGRPVLTGGNGADRRGGPNRRAASRGVRRRAR